MFCERCQTRINVVKQRLIPFSWESLPGKYLYDSAGRRIAIVTDVQLISETVDVTAFGSEIAEVVHGQQNVQIVALGLNPDDNPEEARS